MKTYIGLAKNDDDNVTVISQRDYPLPLRLDLANHSPTGFAWGYGGSGPAQLALALLADHFGDDAKALRLYQRFKHVCIGRLPIDEDFILTSAQIDQVIARDLILSSQVQP
jgi:uncharacterized protein (DUF2249 family)